jgi:dolichol-phosphate mannosyltransferase
VVVIPTYNEGENLPVVVESLLRLPELRVLVVDDASPDGTGEVAERLADRAAGRVSVIHRTGPRGFGRSCIEGMRRALDTDASEICQMDADLSHNPADIERLLERIAAADLVIGSRYVPGGRIENWPARRKLLSAFANRYVRAVAGLRIRDCTSGLRCWRREVLQRLPLDEIVSNGYAFLVEMAWEATAAGCAVAELPITFVERQHGVSKMSARVIAESALLPWRLRHRRHGHGRAVASP